MSPRLFLAIILGLKLAALSTFLAGISRIPAAVVFFGADVALAVQVFAPRTQWLCPVATGFATDRREVWLTIDDGPDPTDTPRILDLLDAHQAKATFFHIGERSRGHEGLLREIRRRGHQVGCHTLTHPVKSFWLAGPRRTEREIAVAVERLRASGLPAEWFRSPVGIKNLFLHRVLERWGLRAVAWTIRTGDVYAGDPMAVVQRVAKKLCPGAIILMHEGPAVASSTRVVAIEAVLELLARHGYRCVLPAAEVLRPPRRGQKVPEVPVAKVGLPLVSTVQKEMP